MVNLADVCGRSYWLLGCAEIRRMKPGGVLAPVNVEKLVNRLERRLAKLEQGVRHDTPEANDLRLAIARLRWGAQMPEGMRLDNPESCKLRGFGCYRANFEDFALSGVSFSRNNDFRSVDDVEAEIIALEQRLATLRPFSREAEETADAIDWIRWALICPRWEDVAIPVRFV